ncbi:hypothetical protein KP509_34G037500 [Ceratopteris richardii]|uniref:EF-hand domain-containing protein n=1 Tax=Ceratopteris richardii TaxID=49495 RepID=A0A8T2QIS2_CERRI|nr:hypothetical protein KP509_34G037500 [Ceratopteris richardii]
MFGTESVLLQKVRKIFTHFDTNGDGGLSREEMTSLVVAVNPHVQFSAQQVEAILDEVFTAYHAFIRDPEGLSFDGLVRTYEDGAGDIDRDFEALSLSLDTDNISTAIASGVFITDQRADAAHLARRTNHKSPCAPSDIVYDSSKLLLQELLIIIRRLEAKLGTLTGKHGDRNSPSSDSFRSSDASCLKGNGPHWDDLGRDFDDFCRKLNEITQKADGFASVEEVVDAHIAVGWVLFDHTLYREALATFMKARHAMPYDARPHFHMGNTLYQLGRYQEAREHFITSLSIAEMADSPWSQLLPQIHVNLGIAMEGEGMLLSACEHYRKATMLAPKHYRAYKLLGSALYGVGEYKRAEKALVQAITLKPDFADAHCDLGSTLHAIGEDNELAIREFQLAVDLNPAHAEALYNLGGLFRDIGRYRKAAGMYAKVLALQPDNWRAQLNKGVTLLGAGETDEAQKAIKEAFRMNNRVELHDAIMHLKFSGRRPKGLCDTVMDIDGKDSPIGRSLVEGPEGGIRIVETSCFRQANRETTPCNLLACALDIRNFQRRTRLNRCTVSDLKKKLDKSRIFASSSAQKHELEGLLRELLYFLKPDAFQDAGLFCAVLVPICGGHRERRTRAAFNVLIERASKGRVRTELPRYDAYMYIKTLHAVYTPSQGKSQVMELPCISEKGAMTMSEFQSLFDHPSMGFGILDIVVKLEATDRIRHDRQVCTICRYPITGPWFKEVTFSFNLCSMCYTEGKVPLSAKQEEYCFKEYNSEVELIKDKFWFLNPWSPNS